MTKMQKVLTAVVSVVLAIALTFGICAIIANSKNDKSQPEAELSGWMGMLKDDTLIKNIAMPGAHDAGTKGLSYLAETQSRDTADLLKCGTRYLDLRVATKKGVGLCIFHGPFKGVLLSEVINSVKTFITANPTEFVILDFQHFDDGTQTKAAALTLTTEILQGLLVPAPVKGTAVADKLTLALVRGKVMIVWGDGYEEVDHAYVFKRNNDEGSRENSVLQSYYKTSLNTKTSPAYIKEALPYYIDCYRKQNCSGLFVLQGQLTDGLFVFGPRFREATHTKKMNKYVDGLKTSADLDVINIVLRDFVSPAKNKLTIALNEQKGNVKTESLVQFKAMVAVGK